MKSTIMIVSLNDDDDDHNEMTNHDDEPAGGIITASGDGVPARVKLHAVYVGCVALYYRL